MAHAHCILDTQGYKSILRICITYCFSIETIVIERAPMLPYTYIACLVQFRTNPPIVTNNMQLVDT